MERWQMWLLRFNRFLVFTRIPQVSLLVLKNKKISALKFVSQNVFNYLSE